MSARSRRPAEERAESERSVLRLLPIVPARSLWIALAAVLVSLAVLATPVGPERGPAVEPEGLAHFEPPPPPRPTPPAVPGRTGVAPEPRARATASEEPRVAPSGAPELSTDESRAARVRLRVVDGATGRAVPAAHVELRATASDSGREARALVVTDARGCWTGPVDPGELVVVAWSGGRSSASAELAVTECGRQEATLELEASFPVHGRIHDAETGVPIAGARVSFWTHAELDVAITAEDGAFRHPRFPRRAETHQVRVEAAGYGSEVRFLEVGAHDEWRLLAPNEGADEQRGACAPAQLSIGLAPATALAGRVLGSDGEPLAGARIDAVGHFAILPGVGSCDRAGGVTDEHGRFTVGELRSDVSHAVTITAPGYAREERVVAPVPGGIAELDDLWLAPEVRLAGAVVDVAGFPAEDLRVSVRAARRPARPEALSERDLGAPLRGVRADTHTDTGGAFSFEGLPHGEYVVKVRDGRRTLIEERVALRAGDPRADLVLALAPSAPMLTGVVRGDSGPVAGARVELRRAGGTRTVTTDAEGRFRASGVDDTSSYELHVVVDGDRGARHEGTLEEVWAGTAPSIQLGAAVPAGSPAGRLAGGP